MFTHFRDIQSLKIDKIEWKRDFKQKMATCHWKHNKETEVFKLNWILISQKNYWCCDLLTFLTSFAVKCKGKQNTRPILWLLFGVNFYTYRHGKYRRKVNEMCVWHVACKRLFEIARVERASGRADRLSRTNNNRKWYVPIFACTKHSHTSTHHPANFAWKQIPIQD